MRRLENGSRGASRGEYSALLWAGRTRVARSMGGASSAFRAYCWLDLRGALGGGSDVVSSERDRAGGVWVVGGGEEEPELPQGASADASVVTARSVKLSGVLCERESELSETSGRR